MTAEQALKQAAALWPDMPFGVLVGMDGDRPFVGYATKDRKLVRFAAATFDLALEHAKRWTDTPDNAWRLESHRKGSD